MSAQLFTQLDLVGLLRSDFSKPKKDPRPIGRILLDMGAITQFGLDHALRLQRGMDAKLGEILVNEDLIEPEDLTAALKEQFGLATAELDKIPPDAKTASLLAADIALEHGVVPWLRFGALLLVATPDPSRFQNLIAAQPNSSVQLVPVLASAEAITRAQHALYGPALVWRAERQVMANLSCRSFAGHTLRRMLLAAFLLNSLIALSILAPTATWLTLSWIALGTLVASITLKSAATLAQLFGERTRATAERSAEVTPLRLPRVSVMVPLLHEREIAAALVRRLSRLTYPKGLLDIVLVLEADDHITKDTLRHTQLPDFIRMIEVPAGSGLRTKPRALNYALNFCKGQIIGIWDAEDAPEPDQITKVVHRFYAAPRDVVCLQGRLDYYNPKANWLARCFTIEYATWWRLILPGLARMGCVVPLGGTSLFFRRKELEELGGWDSHNVTEDADLGVRLARAGYKTELIDTTTWEEANCRAWPWVRQRSRWLKGFAITWAVHMRKPVRLWRDLGTFRFVALQVFFVAALSQFMFAPVFWSFWLILLGMGHPFGTYAGLAGVVAILLTCEAIQLAIHVLAVRREGHRFLIPWTPSMIVYFTLGCVAVYKALWEVITQPFYWDKTQHGVSKH